MHCYVPPLTLLYLHYTSYLFSVTKLMMCEVYSGAYAYTANLSTVHQHEQTGSGSFACCIKRLLLRHILLVLKTYSTNRYPYPYLGDILLPCL